MQICDGPFWALLENYMGISEKNNKKLDKTQGQVVHLFGTSIGNSAESPRICGIQLSKFDLTNIDS